MPTPPPPRPAHCALRTQSGKEPGCAETIATVFRSDLQLLMCARRIPQYECPITATALTGDEKKAFVKHLHILKAHAGVTFDAIAKALGVTNVYAAQLFNNQAQLKPQSAPKLKEIVPGKPVCQRGW